MRFASARNLSGGASFRSRAFTRARVSDAKMRRARVGRARRACAPRSDALPKTCWPRRTNTNRRVPRNRTEREKRFSVDDSCRVSREKSARFKESTPRVLPLVIVRRARVQGDAGGTVRRRAGAAGALRARAPSEDVRPLVQRDRSGVDGDIDVVRAGVRSGLLHAEHGDDVSGSSLRRSGGARSVGGAAPAALHLRHGRLGRRRGGFGEGGIRRIGRVGGKKNEAKRLAKGASVRSAKSRRVRSERRPP